MNTIDVTVFYADEDTGEDIEETISLPAKWEICGSCQGNGKIVNPNIGAITASDWEQDWSPEEQEGYFRGHYDVGCDDCKGSGKVLEVDHEHIPEKMQTLYQLWLEQENDRARWDAEDRATYRMESGHY